MLTNCYKIENIYFQYSKVNYVDYFLWSKSAGNSGNI
jgi:hypothetical protein